MTEKPKVVVAMSGGVDSSVAAALLQQQGYPVIGMMLRLWSEPGSEIENRCCSPDAMSMARRVAAKLGIPFYAVDARDAFHDQVVQYFINGYTAGETPNPCLICNRSIRWEFLLERALAMGAEFMATGHYAHLMRGQDGGIRLYKAVDPAKDQSYVLHVLDQSKLKHAMFPLGEFTKPQAREMARGFGLQVADRADSQDLCFLGSGDYRDFLSRHAPQVSAPGPILDRNGEVLGEHQGLAFYTIGQRKGLGVPSSEPLFVIEKDIFRNTLMVGKREELGSRNLTADRVNWISGESPTTPFQAMVKIRYKAQEAPGTVTPLGEDRFHVHFENPLRDITPGQAAVIYQGDQCLGGGIIMPPA